MGTSRWIRVDVSIVETDWVDLLPGASRWCWIELLLHVKRSGVRGRVRAINTNVFARRANVAPEDVEEMLSAAHADGAIETVDGDWLIAKWDEYQTPDAVRQRRHRDRPIDADTF